MQGVEWGRGRGREVKTAPLTRLGSEGSLEVWLH